MQKSKRILKEKSKKLKKIHQGILQKKQYLYQNNIISKEYISNLYQTYIDNTHNLILIYILYHTHM